MPLANVVEGDPHVAAHNEERGVINELDENAIRKTLADTKGDILVATGADTFVRLPAGANGKVLGADDSTGTGLAWVDGASGAAGTNGWTPVYSVESDSTRRVLKIVDWVGGTGTKPSTTNQYIGPTGIVSSAAAAVDIRGAAGTDGIDGSDGAPGAPGPANTLEVVSVDTVPADQPTTVTVDGTAPNQTLSFSIARGFTGPQGPPGPYGNNVKRTMSSGVLTIDPALATDYTITLTGNISLATSGLFQGAGVIIDLVQDAVGGRTVTLPVDWTGRDQVLLSTTPNTVDRLLVTRNGIGYMVQQTFSSAIASGNWDPNSLSNKTAWFSSNAIQLEPGDTVTSFPNQFGTGDLSTLQGAPKLGLLNGQKYVHFDGIDDALGGTHGTNLVQPFWIAGVFRVPGNGPVVGGPSGQTTAADILVGSGNWTMELASGMTIANSGDWQTVIARYVTGGNDFFHVDATMRNDVNVNTLKVNQYTKLGGDDLGAFGESYVAEVIKCSGLLDAPTLANLQTYLNRIRDDLKGL